MTYVLDTSYLLPFNSIPINIGVNMELFHKQLKKAVDLFPRKLMITNTSIIELQYKVLREYKKTRNEELLDRMTLAVPLLTQSEEFQLINPSENSNILQFANEILKAGHKDYMDCQIFGTAKYFNTPIVSEDDDIKEIIKLIPGWENFQILNWRQFIEKENL